MVLFTVLGILLGCICYVASFVVSAAATAIKLKQKAVKLAEKAKNTAEKTAKTAVNTVNSAGGAAETKADEEDKKFKGIIGKLKAKRKKAKKKKEMTVEERNKARKQEAESGKKKTVKKTAKVTAKAAEATAKAGRKALYVVEKGLIIALKSTSFLLKGLASVIMAFAPVVGIIVTIALISVLLPLAFLTNSMQNGDEWAYRSGGGITYFSADSNIVLADGRSIIQFLSSTDGDYGPLTSGEYNYKAGNQFSSLNAAATWYFDHIVCYDNNGTVTYFPVKNLSTQKAHSYWKDTLKFFPRRFTTQQEMIDDFNSALSSYESSMSYYLAHKDDKDFEGSAPTLSYSYPSDMHDFDQEAPNKSPDSFEYSYTYTKSDGSQGSDKKTLYIYIKDDETLDGNTFVLNSLYRKDYDKLIAADGDRLEKGTDADNNEILYFLGDKDGLVNAKGRANLYGFLDFYVSTLSKGTAFSDFESIKGKNYQDLASGTYTGWTVNSITSVEDYYKLAYGDILYSGNHLAIFLGYNKATGSFYFFNWDSVRVNFPDTSGVQISVDNSPNDEKKWYAYFHYAGTSSVPFLDDIAAGFAMVITTGSTGSYTDLSITGQQPLSTDQTLEQLHDNNSFSVDENGAKTPGIVTVNSKGIATARSANIKRLYDAGVWSKGSVTEVKQIEADCPSSGSSQWINTTKIYQAFSGVYTYNSKEPLTCVRALATYFMDNLIPYDQRGSYKVDFLNKDIRPDCSGFASAYLYMVTDGKFPLNQTSASFASKSISLPAGLTYSTDWANIQAGDVLFYSGHCEIYMGDITVEGTHYYLSTGWGRRKCGFPASYEKDDGRTVNQYTLGGSGTDYTGYVHINVSQLP